MFPLKGDVRLLIGFPTNSIAQSVEGDLEGLGHFYLLSPEPRGAGWLYADRFERTHFKGFQISLSSTLKTQYTPKIAYCQ
jgi:hypothetical protein